MDDRTTLTAFDALNNVLDTVTTPAVSSNLSFQGLVLTGPVDHFTVTEFSGNGYFTLDNLQTATAPEPATLTLLGSGLLVAAALRRRADRKPRARALPRGR